MTRTVAAVAIAAGLAVAVGAPSAITAPIPTVFVAPTGSDTNPGTVFAPVLTFARAYELARPGQVVDVAAGEYGYQRLVRDGSKQSAEKVVFQPAPGALVSVALLDFGQGQLGFPGPQHVMVRDMAVRYLRAWDGSRDLLWHNIDGAHFDVFDATDVVIRGGDYGPCQAPRDDPACVSRIAGRAARITIDGATIHDVTSTDLNNYHVDGLFVRGGTDIAIRNSKFLGNMITNIRVQDQPCCRNTNLLIENNWFAAPLQGDGVRPRWDAIDVDNGINGLVVRNNSFVENAGIQLIGTYNRSRIVANLLNSAGCAPGVTYSRNLFVPFSATAGQRPCGSSDRRVRGFGYLDVAAFDLRLQPNSPAFTAGDPKDCPATDIAGRPRLRGLKCDAGAYERQEALVCQRRKVGKRIRATTRRVALSTVKARLRRGATIGRCRSR